MNEKWAGPRSILFILFCCIYGDDKSSDMAEVGSLVVADFYCIANILLNMNNDLKNDLKNSTFFFLQEKKSL